MATTVYRAPTSGNRPGTVDKTGAKLRALQGRHLRFSSRSPQDASAHLRAGNRSALRGAYALGISHGRMEARGTGPQLNESYKQHIKREYGGERNFQAPHVARQLTPGKLKGRRKLTETAYKAGFDVGAGSRQRRVPAGSPRGGQWTK